MSHEKDDFEVQRARLRRIATELVPGCDVIFDESVGPSNVRMRIEKDGQILTKAFPHWHVTEVADHGDDELRQMLINLAGGLIGPRNSN